MASPGDEGIGDVLFIVKWNGTEYRVSSLTRSSNVLQLKEAIAEMTQVLPHRQKLIGLKMKGTVADDTQLSALKLQAVNKLMMMGSREETIASVAPTKEEEESARCAEEEDDFDFGEESLHVSKQEKYLAKIDKRISEYELKLINPLQEDKKLVVLDIDCTFFDHHSRATHASELARPYLVEFLTAIYPLYNIAIWSATSMKWITTKLDSLGLMSSHDFSFSFLVDELAMITLYIPERGGRVNTKPLGVIWGKFPKFSRKNTVLVDDLRRNFLMSPHNGIKIKPFKHAHQNRATDKELAKLAKYLINLASCEDFSAVSHVHWDRE